FASLAYSGYAHFDGDDLCEAIGETGRAKDGASFGAARRALAAAGAREADAKAARTYGGTADGARAKDDPPWHEHFGFIVVSCDRADLRPTPKGILIDGDGERRFEAMAKPAVPRGAVLDELCDAALDGKAPPHDGAWGLATLEV